MPQWPVSRVESLERQIAEIAKEIEIAEAKTQESRRTLATPQ